MVKDSNGVVRTCAHHVARYDIGEKHLLRQRVAIKGYGSLLGWGPILELDPHSRMSKKEEEEEERTV